MLLSTAQSRRKFDLLYYFLLICFHIVCRLSSCRQIVILNFTIRMVVIVEHGYRCMEETLSIISHLLNCILLEPGCLKNFFVF